MARASKLSITYDNASRLLQISSPGSLNTNFTYNAVGLPLTMNDGVELGTTTSTYDGFNRLASTTNNQGIIKYDYDLANRRTQLRFGPPGTTDANLKKVLYGFDGASRPVTLTNWLSQNAVYSYTGDRLVGLSYPNGVNASYSFDGADRLTSLSHLKPDNSPVFTASYTLDGRGNRTAITENLNGVNRNLSYRYDELSRLLQETTKTGAAPAVSITYQYDPVGNRTRMDSYIPANTKGGLRSGPAPTMVLSSVYAYDVADRLTSRTDTGSATGYNGNVVTFGYDNNDSLTSETNSVSGGEATSYTYDSRNRLTGVQTSKGSGVPSSATFTYDGQNNRVSLAYNGQTTSYLQDTSLGLALDLQETVSGQGGSTYYMYVPGSTTPLFETAVGGVSQWLHADGLDSIRAATGTGGVVKATYAYSVFGLNASTGDTSLVGAGGKTLNSHQFTGEQLDPTGLYYDRARYYSPELGQFTQRDTWTGCPANPLSLNRYAYTQDNPVKWVDPSGNCPGSASTAVKEPPVETPPPPEVVDVPSAPKLPPVIAPEVPGGLLIGAGGVTLVGFAAAALTGAAIGVIFVCTIGHDWIADTWHKEACPGNWDWGKKNTQPLCLGNNCGGGGSGGTGGGRPPQVSPPPANPPTPQTQPQPTPGPTILPPGRCPQATYDRLRQNVVTWCKQQGSSECTNRDSCTQLRQKSSINYKCYEARRTLSQTCFGGADPGHQEAEDNAEKAYNKCQQLLGSKCRQPGR